MPMNRHTSDNEEKRMDFSNLLDMLRNPQALQAQVKEMQQKTASIRATGQSGGGMVKITLSGEMELLECHIAPEVIDPSDPGMLEDLVRAAHNDATSRVKEALQKQLAENMGGLSIPPGTFGGGNPFGSL
jgi:DNA-binding YbaB/EbfC family protein